MNRVFPFYFNQDKLLGLLRHVLRNLSTLKNVFISQFSHKYSCLKLKSKTKNTTKKKRFLLSLIVIILTLTVQRHNFSLYFIILRAQLKLTTPPNVFLNSNHFTFLYTGTNRMFIVFDLEHS